MRYRLTCKNCSLDNIHTVQGSMDEVERFWKNWNNMHSKNMRCVHEYMFEEISGYADSLKPFRLTSRRTTGQTKTNTKTAPDSNTKTAPDSTTKTTAAKPSAQLENSAKASGMVSWNCKKCDLPVTVSYDAYEMSCPHCNRFMVKIKN